jgi:glycerol uptake facilitator-like aquaporin
MEQYHRLTSPSEVEADSPPPHKIIFFEMIGIALLTLGVNNSVYANIADIFIATSLFVAIIFSGPFSGGHVNPAVTLGIN